MQMRNVAAWPCVTQGSVDPSALKTVLVVDDDHDICESLQLLLERRFRVAVAYNGVQALERLTRERVDAMVLDLMMPLMDGESLLRELKERRIEVPVIIASAATQLASRARTAGASAWLEKPFDARQLERALEVALNCNAG